MKVEYGIEFIKRAEKDLPEFITINNINYKLFTQSLLSGSLIIRYGEFINGSYNWSDSTLELFYTIVSNIPSNEEDVKKNVIYKTNVDDIISDCLNKIKNWKVELQSKTKIKEIENKPIIKETPPIKKQKNVTNTNFEKELTTLINKYSIENDSDTPDYMLSEYLIGCLENYNKIIINRNKWYDKS